VFSVHPVGFSDTPGGTDSVSPVEIHLDVLFRTEEKPRIDTSVDAAHNGWRYHYPLNIFAIAYAAPAANPPITVVCIELRSGDAPVNRPLMYPKTASATAVDTTEYPSAVAARGVIMYGDSGIKPPAM
jgi:hypothetical protein